MAMAGFPKLPLVNGDTDDDTSLHLHAQVGPAKPLPIRKNTKDDEILKILNETSEREFQDEDFNKYFKIFQSKGKIDNFLTEDEDEDDFDDNEPETEDEDLIIHQKNIGKERMQGLAQYPNSDSEEEPELSKPNQPLFDQFNKIKDHTNSLLEPSPFNIKRILSIIIPIIVTILAVSAINFTSTESSIPSIRNIERVNLQFKTIDDNFKNLNDAINGLSKKQASVQNKLDILPTSLNSKFELINSNFDAIDAKLRDIASVDVLSSEVENLKQKLSEIEVASNPEPKLVEINQKLEKLTDLNENIESVKTEVFNQLMKSLPEHIPVYIKNKKIHIIPEFQNYLFSFIKNYNMESNSSITWDKFLLENEQKLTSFINSSLNKNSNIKNIDKEKLEKFLSTRLKENNEEIWQKFNQLIDNVNLVGTGSNTAINVDGSDKILLNSLLEGLNKGSIAVNYANYNLGARILGFLTNTGKQTTKSTMRMMFLGWYDYLNSSGASSPKNWKFNANNVLLDNVNSWECESNKCSIGIRVFNSIILSDIIIKNPREKQISNPDFISIYIKPKNFEQANELISFLNKMKINFNPENENKYLKKFIKVQEVSLDSSKTLNHIKLPVSLINLKIPSKDIYFEIKSSQGVTGVNNIKIYGITEFDSNKYNEDFNLVLDQVFDSKLNQNSRTEYHSNDIVINGNSEILGDDDNEISF